MKKVIAVLFLAFAFMSVNVQAGHQGLKGSWGASCYHSATFKLYNGQPLNSSTYMGQTTDWLYLKGLIQNNPGFSGYFQVWFNSPCGGVEVWRVQGGTWYVAPPSN